MINIVSIPSATTSATSLELLIEATEKTCKPYYANSAIKPSGSISFAQGTVQVLGGVAVVPITATITIVTPNPNGCGCAHTSVFTENFNIAFESTETNSVAITPSESVFVEFSDIKGFRARGVKISTVISATIV